MKYDETPLLQAARMTAAAGLRQRLTELRQAYRLQQADVAARAGRSRSTVVLIEKGDPGRTMGQILRYLNAIAPAVTLHALLEGRLLALTMLRSQERTQRFASPQQEELNDLDC